MRPSHRAFFALGRLLQVASIGFVAWLVFQHIGTLPTAPAVLKAIVVAAGLALVVIPLPMIGWWHLVRVGGDPIPFRVVFAVYAQSALAKYLPGNVLHYVGRQILGARHGLAQAAIATASVSEVLLVVAASCTVSILAWPLAPLSPWGLVSATLLRTLLLAGALLPLVACVCLGRIQPGPLRHLKLHILPVSAIGVAFAILVLFVAGGATAMGVIGALAGTRGDLPLAALFAAYGFSYVVGYLTPGSPGGLGVREAALLALLAPVTGHEPALVMAIGLRLSWIAAEAALYLLALWLAPRQPPELPAPNLSG